jgi:hypothetical protein
MRKSRTGASIAVFLVTGLMWAGAPVGAQAADDGQIGIRLLEGPAERQEDPRAHSYIVDHVSPGTTIERAFEISNMTEQARTVRVYPGPARIRDGAFIGEDAGARSELTTWTSVSQRTVRLAAGESAELDATIAVPGDASEGERYGVLWAAVASSGESQVQVVNRVGIRVYLSVGPGGEPASDFEIDSLTPGRTDDGAPYVEATVTNSGGRAIDLQGKLRLADGPGGLNAGPFDVSTGTLAPGDTASLPVELDESLPAGPWKARLVLESGLLEKRASATITFPERGAGATVPTTDDSSWWEGWPLWVGLALLVLLLALLFWLLRRRGSQDDERLPEPEVVATS